MASAANGVKFIVQIAAMPSSSKPELSSIPDTSGNSDNAPVPAVPKPFDSSVPASGSQPVQNTATREGSTDDSLVEGLQARVQELELTPQKDHEGSGSSLDGQDGNMLKRDHFFDDDHTHLSNSSTKMTNFDSKSLASVTTFAMDENNSVRPDDSASVQAIDEEESLSGPASGAPNSVTGSEAGGRGFRDPRDGNAQRSRGVLPVSGPFFSSSNQRGTVNIPPDSVSNNFVIPAIPDGLPDGTTPHGFPLDPDEKLVEAMKSPKDRLLILQLEEKIRYFISDSRPTALSAVHAVVNTTPPPVTLPKKIMRRTDGDRPSMDGSVGASSSAASKAPSENGEAGTDGDQPGSSIGTPAKDRSLLSREAREAKYNEVRERIFRDFPDNPKPDSASGESVHNMSRSSSTSGRKKNNNSSNRQRVQDDGFEGRSQFNAYYLPGASGYNGPMPYNGNVGDGTYAGQVPYLVGPGVSPPTNSFIPQVQTGGMYQGNMGVSNVQPYPLNMSTQMTSNPSWQTGSMPQQSPYSGYASMNQPGMSQQSSTKSSPAMTNYAIPQQGPYQQAASWNQQSYASNYPQPMPQRNQPPVHWPSYPPQSMTPNMTGYSYAQYPGQHMNPGYQAHSHQMMSGGPRSHFNPQTRSFVPGAPPPPRHPNKGPQLPMSTYGGMPPHQAQWSAGYPDQSHNRSMDPLSAGSQGRPPTNTNTNTNSLAKWGTPSHLPPKPPPSEVPSDYDLKHRAGTLPMPTTAQFSGSPIATSNNGPLVVSGE
ncbi:hypothetical protein N7470_007448 [Penicillium chermesinum]|nr:hypothetical protein N7470_007448 [Penicillium chermesinum]